MIAFVENLRPRQWTKNLILFAGLIFSQNTAETGLLFRAAFGFFIFCLLSGAVYVMNDIADAAMDRRHPIKKNRPIASGRLDPRTAAFGAIGLVAMSLVSAFLLGRGFGFTAGGYLLLNVVYTFVLKKIVILDVLGIAGGFVLRAVGSVEVLREATDHIPLSPWLILCTALLAMFLGFAKRRAEFVVEQTGTGTIRPTLHNYSELLLNLLIGGSFALTVTAYILYTVSQGTIAQFQTGNLVFTVPFVVTGMSRYLVLVFKDGQGGHPDEILLTDGRIQLSVLGWIITACLVIGLRQS